MQTMRIPLLTGNCVICCNCWIPHCGPGAHCVSGLQGWWVSDSMISCAPAVCVCAGCFLCSCLVGCKASEQINPQRETLASPLQPHYSLDGHLEFSFSCNCTPGAHGSGRHSRKRFWIWKIIAIWGIPQMFVSY